MNDPGIWSLPAGREMNQDRQASQDFEQFLGVGGPEKIAQEPQSFRFRSRKRQQRIDFVVAEDGSSSHAPPDPQDCQRVRTAIDQVSKTPQLVLIRPETDRCKEPLELAGAALNVPYNPAHDNPTTQAFVGVVRT
jgi:formate-dependent nitrite reductase cytochrome c552 subunit